MRSPTFLLRTTIALATCLIPARPAAAQWTRVTDVPATSVYSIAQRGDTLLAGTGDAVYLSLDGGTTWTRTADVGVSAVPITAARIERGLLWAGTYGQGVWTSADLGASWQDANAGLTGGILDTQRFLAAFESRGDSLYAGTSGAGTYVKRLSTLGSWSVFGPSIVSSTSGNVNDLMGVGDRLLVAPDANGSVFFNDRGDADWTESFLEVGPAGVGLEVNSFAWTGSAWLASTATRVYRSATGSDGWERVGPAVGSRGHSQLASQGGRTFVEFSGFVDAVYFFSPDGGTTWTFLESQPGVTLDLMLRGTDLYAGRTDGLWKRAVGTLGVDAPGPPRDVEFALAGSNPVRGAAALHFALPRAGRVRVTALDLAGRAVGTLADGEYPAGAQHLTWDASGLPPGVYLLRFETPGTERSLRVVLLR
jgi:hypothetical protein